MLQKLPRKSSSRMMGILKGAIIVETAFFCTCAAVWYALCNKPDFRHTMHKHCRPVLNAFLPVFSLHLVWQWLKGFYYVLERYSGDSPRLEDYKKWNITEESHT